MNILKKIFTLYKITKLFICNNCYYLLIYDISQYTKIQERLFKKFDLDRQQGIFKINKILPKNIANEYNMLSEHCLLFSSISLKTNSLNILEIGTYDAKNVDLLSKLFSNSSITTIDLKDDDFNFSNLYNRNNSLIRKNFINERNQIINKLKNVKFIQMNSINLINNKVKYDLIWIDGAHNFPTIAFDIVNSIKLISDNGLIICDDVWINTPFFGEDGYNSIATYKSLLELKKVGIIDFELVFKRLDKKNNCNPKNRKYLAIIKVN